MFSETVLKFYGQEKKKTMHLLLIIVVIISLVKCLSTGDLTMASFLIVFFVLFSLTRKSKHLGSCLFSIISKHVQS